MLRVVVLLGALLLAACGKDGRGTNQDVMQEWVGKNLAHVTVQTLEGKPQALSSLAGTKPIILNVWATWCTPCLKEMPTLDALAKTKAYHVVAISTDRDAPMVMTFLNKQKWDGGMRIWFDPWGAETRSKLGAVGIPMTYVLNPSLTIVMVESGERDWSHPKMLAKMEKALAK